MSNFIRLGTLAKYSATLDFWLHDVQYDIKEFYTRHQILKNKQISRLKVVQFKALVNKEALYVDVEE